MKSIADRLHSYLVRQQVHFRLHQAATSIPDNQVNAALICDGKQSLLAVYPASRHFDLQSLRSQTRHDLQLATRSQTQSLFTDCSPDHLPVIANAYGIRAVVDESIAAMPSVTFYAGNGDVHVEINGRDLFACLAGSTLLSFTSETTGSGSAIGAIQDQQKLYGKLAKLELPMMPETATRIMQFMNHPHARIDELVDVIESDPALTGQILRYAGSPFFGFSGEINSVHKAITIVLGQDMVYSIALGLSMLGKLMMPRAERKEFTRHAVYCAALSQEIARSLPRKYGAKQGRAYLAGLLHNIGRALLFHLYPTDMAHVTEQFRQRPEQPLTELESGVLQINHTQAGQLLLQQWQLEPAICTTARHHHDENYNGDDALYCHITLLANRFLATRDVGEEITDILPTPILSRYEIDENNLRLNLEDILDAADHLDSMVTQLIS